MKDIEIDGMVIAPGVIETIVTMAAEAVDGVAGIGSNAIDDIMNKIQSKPVLPGVEYDTDENGKLKIGVHMDVKYGFVLPDVAAAVRAAVAEAVETQLGVNLGSVDVYIDGIRFE